MGRPYWIAAAFCIIGLGGCDASLSGADRSNLSANTPVVTAADQGGVRFGDVMTAAETWLAEAPAPRFEEYRMPSHCRMPRAGGRAKVYYYYSYGGGQNIPLHAAWKTPDGKTVQYGMLGNVRRTDVMVTETEDPVYLVLASYDEMLWNIQLAPGAEIDGIAVMSYEGAMVANAPDGANVGFVSMRNSPNSRCRVKPRGPAIPVEARIAGAKKLNPDFDSPSYVEQWKADFKETQKFHRQTLRGMIGASADVQLYRTGGVGSQAILAGPVPAEPFAPQPVTSILYQSNMLPLWGTREEAEARVAGGS
ncbi:MAG: hypothetical protein RIB03_11895 [Henriciella sp.]|uniref:hypothetical protein n=1 Tax=Henriciella sp. TaxID=1968823 RepID=UPI0032EC8EFE